jgi:hypothetical protein
MHISPFSIQSDALILITQPPDHADYYVGSSNLQPWLRPCYHALRALYALHDLSRALHALQDPLPTVVAYIRT